MCKETPRQLTLNGSQGRLPGKCGSRVHLFRERKEKGLLGQRPKLRVEGPSYS